MKEINERDIIAVAIDFAKAVGEIDFEYIEDCGYFFRWGKKRIYLDFIYERDITVDEALGYEEDEKEDISEFAEDEECVGRFFIEGHLYETLYSSEGYGSGNEEAKMLLTALRKATSDHGFCFGWSDGAVSIYPLDE